MKEFEKFGFKCPQFKGEILGEIDDYYIGYYFQTFNALEEPQKIPTFWNKKTGCCYKGAGVINSKYSLTPIASKQDTKKFNWKEAEYPCFGISANNDVVCFSSYGVGHVIQEGAYIVGFYSNAWNTAVFKPYTPQKPKTKLWYWELKDEDSEWYIYNVRKSEKDIKEIGSLGYRKLEAFGYREED